MGLFGDVDFSNVPSNPFASPVGTWLGRIVAVETFDGVKVLGAKFLKLVWVKEEDDTSLDDIFTIKDPSLTPAELTKKYSYWKLRMSQLEVPEDMVDSITDEQLIGTRAYVTSAKSGDYTNIKKVVLYTGEDDEPAEEPLPLGDPWSEEASF